MNNPIALSLIEDCSGDLQRIALIIKSLNGMNNAVAYLTKYSIIKVCGTLEQCFKTIIADFSTLNQNQQMKNYVDCTFRESSMNPTKDNIYGSLKKFDVCWNDNFKRFLNEDQHKERIFASLDSLNNARNDFSHGGNPTTTFRDVEMYFIDVQTIIEYLDQSVQ